LEYVKPPSWRARSVPLESFTDEKGADGWDDCCGRVESSAEKV
jgi:hypothetical protein